MGDEGHDARRGVVESAGYFFLRLKMPIAAVYF
jgi:hypothetical protein